MGFLRALLSPEKVRDSVRRRSNLGARFMAVGLGAVTPFCSCSSIPLFIGFVEAGIPLGVTLSFLIASPMINEVAVVVLASVIGWQLTVICVAAGLSALIGGFVLERFGPERWVESYVWNIKVGARTDVEGRLMLSERHRYAVGQVREIVGRIWKFVLIGVGVGVFIHGYVPRDFIVRIAGDGGLLSVLGAVVTGAPLYSDAVGIIPIAEVLLQKRRSDRHRSRLHDGSDRAVAARDDSPAQGRAVAAAGSFRRLSCDRVRRGWLVFQRREDVPMTHAVLHQSIVTPGVAGGAHRRTAPRSGAPATGTPAGLRRQRRADRIGGGPCAPGARRGGGESRFGVRYRARMARAMTAAWPRGETMKHIKVLGTGCANCRATVKIIEETAAARGVPVEVEKVENLADILGYGIMSTPGVVIDGQVVHAGGVPNHRKVDSWLA